MGALVRSEDEAFWSTITAKALHPFRVPMIEALWRIGEPLSANEMVDVLDGFVSVWDAAHHLRVLEALNVVELAPLDASGGTLRHDLFDVPYLLKSWESKGGR